MIYRELDIYGVLLPGLLVVALSALIASIVLRRAFSRFALDRWVWHPELFNIAIFVLVLASLAQALP
ncbi:DUF1656 domain-containing protein [Ensifer sp. R-19]|uniref:DUF1656 domain-containing protein n=1 Tax=Ensifer sp. R-19 TaxID=3404055 RepID=UPI003CE6F3A5